MARHYSPKSFLRQAPNKLLRQYFESIAIGVDLPWDGLDEAEIEPIFAAMTCAPGDIYRACTTDFHDVHDLADEGGVRTLLAEGKHPKHGLDFAADFQRMGSHLERALWVLLKHPDVFKVARRLDYAVGLSFKTRESIPEPLEPVTSASVAGLEKGLSEYYLKQGRGQGCHVDHYSSGDRLYYFCYLEDYAEMTQVYDDEHNLKTERFRPAFEVIFIYDPVERTLDTRAKGGKDVRLDVEDVFAQTVLGVKLGAPSEAGSEHRLDVLLDRHFEFSIQPEDGIEEVSVRELKVALRGRKQRITLDVSAKAPVKEIYDLLDDVLPIQKFPRSDVAVDRARLKVTFRADKDGRRCSLPLTITPNSHTVKTDQREGIIKSCLKRWKLDVSGSDRGSPQKPGEPAQYMLMR